VEANGALEVLEKAMRGLGLTLSIDKTKIVPSGHRATTTPSGNDPDADPEPEPDEDQSEDADETDPAEEYLAWHHAWKKERAKDPGVRKLPPPPPPANLEEFDDLGNLNTNLLSDLVFASPPQLEAVLLLLGRLAVGPTPDLPVVDEVLVKLCSSHRGNAWSALWLLAATQTFWDNGLPKTSVGSVGIIKLARSALKDPRETVRAEAAWVLAQASSLAIDDLRALHVAASPLTEAGIAAVAAYAKATKKGTAANRFESVRASIVAGRPLNHAAAKWGAAAGVTAVAATSAAAAASAVPATASTGADHNADGGNAPASVDSEESADVDT
jgi:hypothetical protein